ncbi:hypothetical protein [Haloplanus sp. C73]|uniref:hypothetical protein n=1 Tax=Haloplanus sp. C73 TaxID=3421641 RepID=UPI003EBB0DF7
MLLALPLLLFYTRDIHQQLYELARLRRILLGGLGAGVLGFIIQMWLSPVWAILSSIVIFGLITVGGEIHHVVENE